jgi:prevent-host-death family protein
MTIVFSGRGELMQTIQASEFKAKCLALMDDVARSRQVLVVTKNGKPVAEIHPYSGSKPVSPFGFIPLFKSRAILLHPSQRAIGRLCLDCSRYTRLGVDGSR